HGRGIATDYLLYNITMSAPDASGASTDVWDYELLYETPSTTFIAGSSWGTTLERYNLHQQVDSTHRLLSRVTQSAQGTYTQTKFFKYGKIPDPTDTTCEIQKFRPQDPGCTASTCMITCLGTQGRFLRAFDQTAYIEGDPVVFDADGDGRD